MNVFISKVANILIWSFHWRSAIVCLIMFLDVILTMWCLCWFYWSFYWWIKDVQSINHFFDLYMNKRLSDQPRGWWFETPSRPLWRHCNDIDKFCYDYSWCNTWMFNMMTSSNGNIFRVTGHLCGKFTGHRLISHTKASDAELWCFLSSEPEWTVE